MRLAPDTLDLSPRFYCLGCGNRLNEAEFQNGTSHCNDCLDMMAERISRAMAAALTKTPEPADSILAGGQGRDTASMHEGSMIMAVIATVGIVVVLAFAVVGLVSLVRAVMGGLL